MIIKPRGLPANHIIARQMPFGAHQGKLVERVFLEHPGYACWFYREGLEKQYRSVHARLTECGKKFDALPYVAARCAGKIEGNSCTKPVVRYSLIPTSSIPEFWCAECRPPESLFTDPFESNSYLEGIKHVWNEGGRRAEAAQNFAQLLARAKGLPDCLDDIQLMKFFHGSDAVLLE